MDNILVKIAGLSFDVITHQPVVFLQEADGKKVLPIWIGMPEAQAIASVLTKKAFPRPLTHDLIKDIIEGLDTRLTKVVINKLVNDTYHARILLTRKNTVTELDARPSDSIAMALRTSAPIYVASEILTDNRTFTITDKDELKHRFQELEPEEFGKSNF